MNQNDDDEVLDEPPPSYEEATGRPSITYRPQAAPAHGRSASTSSKPGRGGGGGGHQSTSPTSPQSYHRPPPAQTFSQLLQQRPSARPFPALVNLYRDAFPGALQRRHFLGEHQQAPLYAVGAWGVGPAGFGFGGGAWPPGPAGGLVLHNGPSEDFAPLATVTYDARWGGGFVGAGGGGSRGGRRMDVLLPPLPGQARSEPIPVQGPTALTPSFQFRVEVPWPDGTGGGGGGGGTAWRREAFEWRRSTSLAVAGLAGAGAGWKLVRLSNELPPGGLTVAGSGPPAGDGRETVAVCTDSVMSLTKMWKFCFLGTGVSGVLGERWAVMAVMTGLVIWDLDHRR